MSNIELSCNNISKNFSGKPVFKNLSFRISSGMSLSINGKNGSGKSTLIKIISNLIQPSDGEISVNENNMELPKENWFYKTGLLSPYLNLYGELTGYENLEFFFNLRSDDKNNSNEKINSLMEYVDLYKSRNDYFKNYSSGMKQRLKIAFAVMCNPQILLMDEPRSNLDSSGIEMIRKIADRQKQNGILIIATNDEEDKKLCEGSINIEDFK